MPPRGTTFQNPWSKKSMASMIVVRWFSRLATGPDRSLRRIAPILGKMTFLDIIGIITLHISAALACSFQSEKSSTIIQKISIPICSAWLIGGWVIFGPRWPAAGTINISLRAAIPLQQPHGATDIKPETGLSAVLIEPTTMSDTVAADCLHPYTGSSEFPRDVKSLGRRKPGKASQRQPTRSANCARQEAARDFEGFTFFV